MNAAIIGSNGYIGRHLSKYWLEQGYQARFFDVNDQSTDHLPNYSSLNLKDLDAIKQLNFEGTDLIFLLAGLTGTSQAFANFSQFIDLNEKALLGILEQMRATNPKARIIFPSTRLVYKGAENTPLKEDAPKEFKTIYALNKFACEQYLQMYAQYFGINHTIARICVPYGNEMDNSYSFGTIGFFLNKALKNEDITIYGSGNQKRSLIHIHDLVRALTCVALAPEAANQTYNLGGNDTLSIADIAQAIAKKYDVKVQNTDFPPLDAAIESGDTIFDSSYFERSFDFEYLQNFKNWLNAI